MKVVVFMNSLGLGGTEKAACRWARGLRDRGHTVFVLALTEGPRRSELEDAGIVTRNVEIVPVAIQRELRELRPDVIHAHTPGNPHFGDVLGGALALLPKIPVVQTNVFGLLENPREDHWTDFRLFISWTSCVQAARRALRPLDKAFFQRASVAVYPLDPDDGPDAGEVSQFRHAHGVKANEVLFGRLSRPDPTKWSGLGLAAFRRASRENPDIKLLLREPPPDVTQHLENSPDRDRFVILEATSDAADLRRTMASLDVILHTSSIGESFGYGIAEPMNLGKPVITNSTPCADQAQIELVRHGECGYVASTVSSMTKAVLNLANNDTSRLRMGDRAQQHIRRISDPDTSLDRLEFALRTVIARADNVHAAEDLATAQAAAAYLDQEQFGHTLEERFALSLFCSRVRFYEWRRRFRERLTL